jgi:hypothetical protein
MANNQGIVEKIDGKQIAISGIIKNYNKPIKFEVGDVVEYRINKNQSKNRFDVILKVESVPVEKKPILDISSVETSVEKNMEVVRRKSHSEEGKMSFDEFMSSKVFKKSGNLIVTEFIEPSNIGMRFDFTDITNAQFSSFHDVVIKHNYLFSSEELRGFIEDRIKRERGSKFYKSFNKSFIGRLEELYEMPELSVIKENKNLLNKELFLLLKKYYRYEKAKKFIEGEK